MKITEALAGVRRLYVETAPFIYYVEEHPTYTGKMEQIFDLFETDTVEVFTSVVTLTETLTKPLKVGDHAAVEAYRTLLQRTQHIHLLPISTRIAERAADLRSRYNLRTPDALQIAASLDFECNAFLTNDLKLKRAVEVHVLVLDELELDPPPDET